MHGIRKILDLLEGSGKIAAMALMMACMLIVSTDVVFRYAFASPFAWSINVLTIYVLPGIFFLGLPASYTGLSHVSVDLILGYVSKRIVLALSALARIAAICVFVVIAWYAWDRFVEAWMRGEVEPGPNIDWPVWPRLLMVPVASVLIAARATERLLAELSAAMDGGNTARLDDAVSRATPRGEML